MEYSKDRIRKRASGVTFKCWQPAALQTLCFRMSRERLKATRKSDYVWRNEPVDAEAILALYDLEQRIDVDFPGVRKERRPHLIRSVSETGGPHFILYSRLAAPTSRRSSPRSRPIAARWAGVRPRPAGGPARAARGALRLSAADDGVGLHVRERPLVTTCAIRRQKSET